MVVVGTDSPHDQPRRARRVRVRHRRHGDGERLGAWAAVLNVEVPATIKVVVDGRLPRVRGAEGPDPPSHRPAHGAGRELPVLEFHGRDDRAMPTSGRLVPLQHGGRGGRHRRASCRRDEETVRYLREEAGVTEPIDLVASPTPTRCTSGSIEIDVVEARAADRLPAHGRQRQARDDGRGHAGAPGRHRLVHERAARRPRQSRRASCADDTSRDGTRMLVFPASARIYQQALRRATWATSWRPAPW